jgi:hypothetical protein
MGISLQNSTFIRHLSTNPHNIYSLTSVSFNPHTVYFPPTEMAIDLKGSQLLRVQEVA